jgi:hypothetical protein
MSGDSRRSLEDVDSVEPRDGRMDLDKGQSRVHDSIVQQTLTSERAKAAESSIQAVKRQHRVTRTRVNGGKLRAFRRLPRPVWIRRVLVRAQEGQWPAQLRRPSF